MGASVRVPPPPLPPPSPCSDDDGRRVDLLGSCTVGGPDTVRIVPAVDTCILTGGLSTGTAFTLEYTLLYTTCA